MKHPEIRKQRATYERSAERLRRARRLAGKLTYARFMAMKPTAARDDAFDELTAKALAIGLWHNNPKSPGTSMRHARYAFLRRWQKLTPGYEDRFGWHRWTYDFHWFCYTWRTQVPEKKTA